MIGVCIMCVCIVVDDIWGVCIIFSIRSVPIIGLVIGYICFVFAYWFHIGNMYKQAADTDIHKHLVMGTCAVVSPVYAMSSVD